MSNGAYYRTVRIERRDQTHTGFIEVRHAAAERVLTVRLSDALLPACAVVLERVKRLFDLDADPVAIDRALGALAEKRPGLRLPGSFDSFEMAVRAVLGQQVSVASARTLAGRVAERFGDAAANAGCGANPLIPDASTHRLGFTGRYRQAW